MRERTEQRRSPVEGALAIPLSQLIRRATELPDDRPLAFLCTTGRRSAVAALLARRLGREAHNVIGGLRRWEAG